ncbi:MAG: PilZ domain-containing protein [Treponema sp.]|nr:PilZ domain-containing protein [Treponema sp.]
MSFLIALIIAVACVTVFGKIYSLNKVKIDFFFRGYDEGFHSSEISLLWNLSKECSLEDPISLFYSMPALTKCIAHIKTKAEHEGSSNEEKTQRMLSKLYQFRNKIEKDADKKRGLESTRYLSAHQKLRIILPGKGVFSSELMNNGKMLIISVPTQKGLIVIDGKQWVGQSIHVYLWRTGDARYVFDTKVSGEGLFLGKPCIFLEHTTNLIRTQKRNAIRSKCHITADLYILKDKNVDYSIVESKPGLKCLLEDISESGALIRIGGKGIPNLQLRLQFQLDYRLVVMFGIVRTVEYNSEAKQSRLHFECIHIEPVMKNIVLSYVYKIMSDNDKEIFEALSLTYSDEKEDSVDEKNEAQKPSEEKKENSEQTAEKLNGFISETDEILKEKGLENPEKEKNELRLQEVDDLPVLDLE